MAIMCKIFGNICKGFIYSAIMQFILHAECEQFTDDLDSVGGTQHTPVRQKMKTMSRSLQMLNVARFNVKAQKSQTEADSSSAAKGTVKRGKRCSSERSRPGPMRE